MIYSYVAIYNNNKIEISGEDLHLYEAKQIAIKKLKTPKKKEHLMVIMLAEKDGKQVVHSPTF